MIKPYKVKQIRFSYLWLPALIVLPLFHVTKIVFFIFLILSLHEGAHVVVAKLLGYKMEKITIYPFGLSAEIPELGYGSLMKEICIICAGPLSQVLFPTLFRTLLQVGWISYDFCEYLNMINASIMVFNVLPIYPLDGGRLLQSLFHCLFRFRKAQRWTCIASLVVLSLLFYSQLMKGMSALLMQCFLLIQIYLCYRDVTHMQVKFFHYRFYHPVKYPIIMNRKKDMFRGRYNLMCMKKGYCTEENWLKQQFSNGKKDSRNAS